MRGEYAAWGRIGVGTPQANPTVEAEFQRLLPADVALVTTRLHSASDAPRTRLLDYLHRLGDYLDAFGGMPLDLFCFACTGSSYLAGSAAESAIVDRAAQRLGYPVLTATDALSRQLDRLNARRIALVAPYPEWLLTAAAGFWTARGLQLTRTLRVRTRQAEDTRSIYELTSADALAAIRQLGPVDADALVLSGTGMATLPILDEARAITGVPVLTSNLALVEEALRMLPEPPR